MSAKKTIQTITEVEVHLMAIVLDIYLFSGCLSLNPTEIRPTLNHIIYNYFVKVLLVNC